MSSTLNKKAVRALIFARLEHKRPHLAEKMTQVSEGTYHHLEYRLRLAIDDCVDRMGTVGATIRFDAQ